MRVLLTGGNGFVGSHAADALVGAGVELRCLLRPTSNLEFLHDLAYERADGDIRSRESLTEAVKGVDVVVHSAGLTGGLHERDYREVNAGGTDSLVRASVEAGVKRFVYISSLAAQGSSPNSRAQDPQMVVPHPSSPYGRSKLGGEIAALAARNDIEVVIVRPPVVYGPRDRGLLPFHRLVGNHLMPLYGDGSRRISWIFARDLAAALTEVAIEGADSGSIFTLCDGGTYSWSELANLLGKALNRRHVQVPIPTALFSFAGAACGAGARVIGKPLPLTPDRVKEMAHPFWICSNDRIADELRWRPRVTAEEGLAETVRWYREHRWL